MRDHTAATAFRHSLAASARRSAALIANEMALKIEGVVDRGMHAEETLGRSSCFEPLYLALSALHRLMRLGAIVLPEPLLMRAGQLQLPERHAVGAQLVGYRQFRHTS